MGLLRVRGFVWEKPFNDLTHLAVGQQTVSRDAGPPASESASARKTE